MEPTRSSTLARSGLLLLALVAWSGTCAMAFGVFRAESDRVHLELREISRTLDEIDARLTPKKRYVKPGEIIRVPRVGDVMITDPEDLIQRHLIVFEAWESRVIDLFERFLKAGDTVVDAGAYIGTHTLAMSRLVGPEGRVFAFEPSSAAASHLRVNLRLNATTNVTLIEKALGSENAAGTMEIIDRTNLGANKVCIDDGHGSCKNVTSSGDHFEIVRFDDLGIEGVRLMKLDVETFELPVLRGSVQTIQRDRPVIILEAVYDPEEPGKSQNRPALDFLEERGYEFTQIDHGTCLALPR